MRRVFPLLLCIAIFLAACTGSTPAAPTPTAAGPAPVQATDTPVPATSTPVASTSTPVPPTATPVPPSRWYWAIEDGTNTILAVDQVGNRRELGSLSVSDQANYRAFPVDTERAVLFAEIDSSIHAFLLTPDGMQPIDLPFLPIYDDTSRYGWSVPAVYADALAFVYITQTGYSSDQGGMADRGPLVLVDLRSLTGAIIDEDVNRNVFTSAMDEPRLWAHLSEDGRLLRYLNGDTTEMSLRELDLATGEVRTVYTTTRHNTSRVLGSLPGDLWRFMRDDVVIDIDGNRMPFPGDTHAFLPLRGGRALLVPYDCADDCELTAVSPFTGDPETTYRLPWSSSRTHDPLVNQVTPDGSLIFHGAPLARLSTPPALQAEIPTLQNIDEPVFRLTPDGGGRIVGILDFALDSIPASTDGQYLLLEAVDHTSFFIYDVFADRPAAELPALPDLDYFWANIVFRENGILVQFTAATPDSNYRDFYLLYSFVSGTSISWDDEAGLFMDCEDILPDDSVVCWAYDEAGQSSSLVRYQPRTGETAVLLENAIGLTIP